jgi:hypothetical protein
MMAASARESQVGGQPFASSLLQMMKATMPLQWWKLLLLLVSVQSVHCRSGIVAFAGGGFGSSSSAKKSKKKPDNKKRKRASFAEIEQPPPKVEKEDEPKLDKWGLPIPTEDDLFPPMPPGTELIPAQQGSTLLKDIEQAMKDHITLAYNNFDEHGVELSPTPGNPPMKLKLLHTSPPGMLCFTAPCFHVASCLDSTLQLTLYF